MVNPISQETLERLAGVLENQHKVGEGSIGERPVKPTDHQRWSEELQSLPEKPGAQKFVKTIQNIGVQRSEDASAPPFDTALEEGEEF